MKKLAKVFAVVAGLLATVTLSSCAQIISGPVLGYYYYEGKQAEVWIEKAHEGTGYDLALFDESFNFLGCADGIKFKNGESLTLTSSSSVNATSNSAYRAAIEAYTDPYGGYNYDPSSYSDASSQTLGNTGTTTSGTYSVTIVSKSKISVTGPITDTCKRAHIIKAGLNAEKMLTN